jgi:hypothetical protein
MQQLIQLFSYSCVLIAAVIMGKWFIAELQKVRAAGKPLYAAYATTPGILIILFILILPVAIRFLIH